MLKSVHQASGLGSPPDTFYTNDVEKANQIIQRKTNYKAFEWSDFCKLAKDLVEEQENEFEKAVIGVGEYSFDNEYAHLEVPLAKWSSMSQAQRKRYLERIRKFTLHEAKAFGRENCLSSSVLSTSASGNAPSYSICGDQFSVDGCQLSADILQYMLERLILAPNSINYVHHRDQAMPNFLRANQNSGHIL